MCIHGGQNSTGTDFPQATELHSSTIVQILHTHLPTVGRLDRQVTGCNATQTYTSQPIRKFKNRTKIGRPMSFVSAYFQNRQLIFPVVFKAGVSGRGAMLTTDVHSAPTLRINTALLRLPLFGFMAWAGTNIPFLYDSLKNTSYFPNILSIPVLDVNHTINQLLFC